MAFNLELLSYFTEKLWSKSKDTFVEHEEGKQLTTNDFSDEYKQNVDDVVLNTATHEQRITDLENEPPVPDGVASYTNDNEVKNYDKTFSGYLHKEDGLILPKTTMDNILDDTGRTLSGIMGMNATKVDVTVLANNWVGKSVPYTNTVAVNIVTDKDTIDLMIPEDISATELMAYQDANIVTASQDMGSVTLYAWGEKPEVDLPLIVNIRGYSIKSISDYEITETLVAGATTLSLVDEIVHPDSIIEIYTDKYDIAPSNVVINDGSIDLTFDAQEEDVTVKVFVKYQGADSDNHVNKVIDSEHGVHGIRCFDGKIQVKQSDTWTDMVSNVEVDGVLNVGETVIVLSDERILETSMIEIYTSKYGISPLNVEVVDGSATLTFDVQEENIIVKVVCK